MRTNSRRTVVSSLLPQARATAFALGVTRCAAITRLDLLGIPVWTATRPNAHPDSICVHAGKGASDDEAELGALLESVEFACAENHVRSLGDISLRELFEDSHRPCQHIDQLAPCLNARGHAERRIAIVEATELRTGHLRLVPAQLVAHRHPDALDLFGTTTNGLAAGGDRDDAILHALLEVIERDITSHEHVATTAKQIDPGTLPESVCSLLVYWRACGIECLLEGVPNAFDVTYIRATLYDANEPDATFICAGYGCHLDAEIALWRAISEAAQSRLSQIHGARDDLVERATVLSGLSVFDRQRYGKLLLNSISHEMQALDDVRWSGTAATGIDLLLARLAQPGIESPLLVDISKDSTVPVVRVIVPGLEIFERKHRRVGARLKVFAATQNDH